MSFGNDLKRFRENYIKRHTEVKRMSAFALFSAIIVETPVDKGVLRNNWFVSMEAPSDETTKIGDKTKTGRVTIERMKVELEKTEPTVDIFMVNNLPYAEPIEYDGHSGKAPAGMVRVNTVRWDLIVTQVNRKVGRQKL